jgi:hypothetical protein
MWIEEDAPEPRPQAVVDTLLVVALLSVVGLIVLAILVYLFA